MNTVFFSRLIGMLAVAASTSVWAEPSSACAAKRHAIETQLAQANAAGRSHQAGGLERALAANVAHCSDAVLAQQRQEDIEQAKHKLAKREKDLDEAQAKGDAQKIARRQAQLEAARQRLLEAQQPLPQ